MPFRESDFLAMVQRRVAARRNDVPLGFGDDAAVLDAAGRRVVVAMDLTLEGIDFVLADCGHRRAGHKALARNLSDLAAMGVEPWCAFLSVAFPPGTAAADAEALLDGLLALGDRHGCALAGGDTKRSPGPLVLDVAVTGRERGRPAVTRAGARPGDVLVVTGPLGGAALGRHLDFEPRVAEGLRLNEEHGARAMIDLSDGLSTDLHRLCRASGVGAVLTADAIPLSDAAHRLAEDDGRTPLAHALHDGEDYELLAALPPDLAARLGSDPLLNDARVVGVCTTGSDVLLEGPAGRRPLPAGGFEHDFAERPR